MRIHLTTPVALAALILLSSCAAVTTMFAPQTSENFALLEGTRANHPGLIDGDLRISGASEPPNEESTRNARMTSPPTEAVVLLPVEKTITKIVVHSDQILSLDLLFETPTSGWVLHDRYDGLKGPRIVLKPRRLVSASGVKLRIRKGTGDRKVRQENIERTGYTTWISGATNAPVEIKEIEILGPVTSKASDPVAEIEAAETTEDATTTPEDLLLDGLIN
jgi:hypothetical protein